MPTEWYRKYMDTRITVAVSFLLWIATGNMNVSRETFKSGSLRQSLSRLSIGCSSCCLGD